MKATKEQEALTKPSQPEKVDVYMAKLKYPLADVTAALRKIILSTDRELAKRSSGTRRPFSIRAK